jgi:hypothetical protein
MKKRKRENANHVALTCKGRRLRKTEGKQKVIGSDGHHCVEV